MTSGQPDLVPYHRQICFSSPFGTEEWVRLEDVSPRQTLLLIRATAHAPVTASLVSVSEEVVAIHAPPRVLFVLDGRLPQDLQLQDALVGQMNTEARLSVVVEEFDLDGAIQDPELRPMVEIASESMSKLLGFDLVVGFGPVGGSVVSRVQEDGCIDGACTYVVRADASGPSGLLPLPPKGHTGAKSSPCLCRHQSS